MNINLHIERLVLDNLPITRQQGPLVQAAVERELSRLLTEQGFASSPSDLSVPAVKTDGIQLDSNNPDPMQLGTQIAQSVYGGITRT
jgi:hypothetical protein